VCGAWRSRVRVGRVGVPVPANIAAGASVRTVAVGKTPAAGSVVFPAARVGRAPYRVGTEPYATLPTGAPSMRATPSDPASTAPATPVPELEERRRDFREAAAEARALAEGLTPAQLLWRPAPERWSVAECLDHLVTTADRILEHLDPAVERARALGVTGSPPFRYGRLGELFVRATGPEPVWWSRVPAPRIYRPRPQPPAERVLPAFLELQERLAERIRRAEGLDLGRVKVRSPVSPLLRISLGQWLASIAGHQRRHLIQARAVRGHPDFPAG
jgi:hypothetical protein